jgi:hypothetical protein
MMNEHGKSDRPIVPEKSPNKARPMAAEGVEGRGLAKGNRHQQNALRTQSRGRRAEGVGASTRKGRRGLSLTSVSTQGKSRMR